MRPSFLARVPMLEDKIAAPLAIEYQGKGQSVVMENAKLKTWIFAGLLCLVPGLVVAGSGKATTGAAEATSATPLLALAKKAKTPFPTRVAQALASLEQRRSVIAELEKRLDASKGQGRSLISRLTRSSSDDELAELLLQLTNEYGGLGVTYDLIGRHDESLAAFRTVVELSPFGEPAWFSIGGQLANLGRYDEAEEAFGRGPTRGPHLAGFLAIPAAYYLQSAQYRKVKQFVLAVSFVDDPQIRVYAAIRGVLAAKGSGQNIGPFVDLVGRSYASIETPWPAPILAYLLGEATEAQLAQRVVGDDGAPDMDRLCEALYYVGHSRELAGDVSGAMSYYQSTLATGVTDFHEYRGAIAGLQRLAHVASK